MMKVGAANSPLFPLYVMISHWLSGLISVDFLLVWDISCVGGFGIDTTWDHCDLPSFDVDTRFALTGFNLHLVL